MSLTVGIDVGGTFTDFVAADAARGELLVHKSPSTPADPSDGVMNGLAELAERTGTDLGGLLDGVDLIVHGTTVTTNAVLTESGARTGLLTTEGFRDVLEMRRGVRSRKHLYDNKYVAPRPLVPRHRRLPVRERVDVGGRELQPLDVDAATQAIDALLEQDVEAIAICLMHAYANPDHERELRELVERRAPGRFVSVSSEVLPQVRLYHRVGTTAMNAYVGPVLRAYVERLVDRLQESGFGGVLLVMQSNGGVAMPDIVARFPATTVLSGPAGGPVAGHAYARGQGADDCLVVDMGGTSYDVSIVRRGKVQVTHDGEINRHVIALPMLDVHTIGAGGGSIGWVDEGGLLRMGPHSAGADPGPAAYGRGGTEPTSTDADVVLGYLDPDYFLGGRIRLDPERAREAVERRVAGPLGLDAVAAAAAMHEVINLVMAAGTKDMALQRGIDPSELPLVVAGGAGPLHAAPIADELGIDTVIVPRTSAVLCALGMVVADLRHDYVQAYRNEWDAVDAADAHRVVEGMVERGMAALEHEGIPPERREAIGAADLRYVGQHHEVAVEFPIADLAEGRLDRIEEAFHRRHEELYGFSSPGRPMEIIGLHVTVLGRRAAPPLGGALDGDRGRRSARKGRRAAYLPGAGELVDIDVYDGERLGRDERVRGPAIVEVPTTTVLVPEAFELSVDASASFVMHRRDREASR